MQTTTNNPTETISTSFTPTPNKGPIPKDSHFTMVEMPVQVENVNRALKMVGGVSAIERVALTNEQKHLEFRMRPSHHSQSHPAFGDLSQNNHLLCRVRKFKNGTVKSEIIGQVNHCIRFEGMFDFQFLPPNSQTTQTNLHKLDEKDTKDILIQDLIGNEFNLAPPLYTRFDRPQQYNFRPNPYASVVKSTSSSTTKSKSSSSSAPSSSATANTSATEQNNSNTEMEEPHVALRFGIKPSTIPTISISFEKAVENPNIIPMQLPESIKNEIKFKHFANEERNINIDEMLSIIQNCFEKRPIWSRRALGQHLLMDLNCSRSALKKVRKCLSLVAYVFANGPWKMLWVRYGYNPLTDKQNSYIYQQLEFRVPLELKEYLKPQQKDSDGDVLMDDQEQENGSQSEEELDESDMNVTSSSTNSSYTKSSLANKLKPKRRTGLYQNIQQEQDSTSNWTAGYKFVSLPAQIHTFYQLCDIRLRSVKELLENKSQVLNSELTDKNGWIRPNVVSQIRDLMKTKVEKWIVEQQQTGSINYEADEEMYDSQDEENEKETEKEIAGEEVGLE